jgi:hypothetical protein
MDLEGRMAGHTMRWIRRRMIDQAETNRSTTKPDPDEMRQRLVAVSGRVSDLNDNKYNV